MKACYLPHSKPMIQHDDSLRTITQDRISDPSGQFNRKLNFRLREVNIAQFKIALSLLWIAFPVPEAYTVTDEHLLMHNHETSVPSM